MVIFTRGLKSFKQLITIAMLMISRSEIIAFADDSYDLYLLNIF